MIRVTIAAPSRTGSALGSNADGRSAAARRFKDILQQILADLGGADILSEGQRQLCRRAATLSIQAESMEANAIAGKPFDTDLYGQLTDRLGRCLQRLGLERRQRPVNDGPDNALIDYFSRPPRRPEAVE